MKFCCTSTMIDLIQQFSTLHHHPKSAVLQLTFLYSDEVVTFTTIRICAVHQRIKFDYQDFTASLPCEILLYINMIYKKNLKMPPSLPCEILLYISLNQWHYRLLQNFNLFTNEESMIPIHLYFRHYCQGP